MDPIHSKKIPSKLTTSQAQEPQKLRALPNRGGPLSRIKQSRPFQSISRLFQSKRSESSDTAKTLFKIQDCVEHIFSFLEIQEVKAASIGAYRLIPATLYLHGASGSSESEKMTPTHLSNFPIGSRLLLRRESLYTLLLGRQLLGVQKPVHGTLPELSLLKTSSKTSSLLLLAAENPTEALDPTIFAASLLHVEGDKDKKEAIEKLANSSERIRTNELYRIAVKMVNQEPFSRLKALCTAIGEGHLHLVKTFASKLEQVTLSYYEKRDLKQSISLLFFPSRFNQEEAIEVLKEVESYGFVEDLKFSAVKGAIERSNVAGFNPLIEWDPTLEDRLRVNQDCLLFAGRHKLQDFLSRCLEKDPSRFNFYGAIAGAAAGGHIELVQELLNHPNENKRACYLTALINLVYSKGPELSKEMEDELMEGILYSTFKKPNSEEMIHIGAILLLIKLDKINLAAKIFDNIKESISISSDNIFKYGLEFICSCLLVPNSLLKHWTLDSAVLKLEKSGLVEFARRLEALDKNKAKRLL